MEAVSEDLPSTPPPSAPPQLQGLWALVLKYGRSDDVGREEVLEGASSEELQTLVNLVDKDAFDAINRYLDDTDNSEEAVPFGDLAQAAMEAGAILDHRAGT
jgi:hypothetical protein